MTRREWVQRSGLAAAGSVVAESLPALLSAAGDEPTIISLDSSLIDDWLTPNELYFVREHFPTPLIAAEDWKLSVTGAVGQPFEIGYQELLGLPRLDLAVTLECAGNAVGGGLVSNAEWSGVSLSAVLNRAQPTGAAKYVQLKGADGELDRNLFYARSILIEKARHPDTLLAYGMNGETLPQNHGFPVRAVIPGWYGMDSVKWLREMEVLTSEDTSILMTRRYRRETRLGDGGTKFERVAEMQVKATFSRPLDGAILLGRRMVLRGMAWAGERAVKKVEISTNGGRDWNAAEMLSANGPPRPYAWAAWKYHWRNMEPGRHELLARATDDQGRVQPPSRPDNRVDPNERNHYQRVRCVVA